MKSENCYSVYMHVSPGGKKYIGITSRRLSKRWNNGKGYKNNVYFSAAIEKYGWNSFEHLILHENINKEQAEEKEVYYIEKFNTTNREYGYNIQLGGNSIGCCSLETKRKISDANTGNKHTEEAKDKISKSLTGIKRTPEHQKKLNKALTGKKLSFITKDKISKSKKGEITNGMFKKGIGVRTGQVNSPSHREKISNSLKNSIKAKKQIEKLTELKKKKVVCLNTGVVFNSIYEAGQWCGLKKFGNIG